MYMFFTEINFFVGYICDLKRLNSRLSNWLNGGIHYNVKMDKLMFQPCPPPI